MDLVTHRSETEIPRWFIALTGPFNTVGSGACQLAFVQLGTERSDFKNFVINPYDDAVRSHVGVGIFPTVNFVEIKHDHNRGSIGGDGVFLAWGALV